MVFKMLCFGVLFLPYGLGHIHEHGCVMGFVLEVIKGCPAKIEDLSRCRSVLQRLHDHGLLHGDVNRYNFVVQHNGAVRLVDFEGIQVCADDPGSMQDEMASLYDQLVEETGRGGGFRFACT